MTVLVMIAITIVAAFILTRTTVGRRFIASSVNPNAATAVGIRLDLYRVATYSLAGFCYAAAGILLAATVVTPSVYSGLPYLLASVAAVVLGGNSIGGGMRGSVVATVIGASVPELPQPVRPSAWLRYRLPQHRAGRHHHSELRAPRSGAPLAGCRFAPMNRMLDRDTSIEAAAPPLMVLRGIRKSFGPVHALSGVDLVIRPGEVHAIVGENGAGKSTLIAIAAGVLRADAGTIEYDGREIADPQAEALRVAGVSVTFQHPDARAGPDRSGKPADRLAGAQRTGGRRRSPPPARPWWRPRNSASRSTDGSQSFRSRSAILVETARALSTRPKVVFFDEPTEPFQRAEIQKLFDLIRTMRDEGIAIVYVSHRLPEVTELADRISVMRDGEIIESKPANSITHNEIITLIAGRPIGQAFPDKSRSVGDVLLETTGLSGRGFSKVDFVARAGEIVGVAGVEGEGQREFLRAIAGMNDRSEGYALRSTAAPCTRAARSRPAAPASASCPTTATRRDCFSRCRCARISGIGSIGEVSRGGVIDRRAEIKLADDMVERLRVRTASIESPVSDLSGGNQQKVLIGREMAGEPTVLLVDEPTKGVDVGARAEIYQRLRTSADQGLAVVVCSSDGIELEGLCDRVLIFARGQIVKELTGANVTDAAITEANLTATVSRTDAGRQEGRCRRPLAARSRQRSFPGGHPRGAHRHHSRCDAVSERVLSVRLQHFHHAHLPRHRHLHLDGAAGDDPGGRDRPLGRRARWPCRGVRIIPHARRRRTCRCRRQRPLHSDADDRFWPPPGMADDRDAHPGDHRDAWRRSSDCRACRSRCGRERQARSATGCQMCCSSRS